MRHRTTTLISTAIVVLALLNVCHFYLPPHDASRSGYTQSFRAASVARRAGHVVERVPNHQSYVVGEVSTTVSRFSYGAYSTAVPPTNSLFWTLWADNAQLANASLSTAFVTALRARSLPRPAYEAWQWSDAFYCAHSATLYALASGRAERAGDSALASFLAEKHRWYVSYNGVFDVNGSLAHGGVSEPSRVIAQYVAFETAVALHLHPVYTVIVMMPCEWLWAWLTRQLASEMRPSDMYWSWVEYNMDTAPAFASANFLDAYMNAHRNVVDPDVAHALYSTAMAFEIDNFNDIRIK